MLDKESISTIVEKVITEIEKDYIIVPKFKPAYMSNAKEPFLELVMGFVCGEYGLIPEQIKANSRKEPVISARQLYFYLCAKNKPKGLTHEAIGGYVNKSHSMVVNGPNNMLNIMSVDKNYRDKITLLEEKFNELLKTK